MLNIGMLGLETKTKEYIKKILLEEVSKCSDWELYEIQNYTELEMLMGAHDLCLDVIFVDMENEECEQVRDRLAETHSDTTLFYISSKTKNVIESYKCGDIPYVLKPLRENDVVNALKYFIDERNRKNECYHIRIKGEEINIPLETILYFESNYRTVIVWTKYGKYEYYDKLNNVDNKLQNAGFLRCHQSYLVSLQKITDYDGKNIQIGKYSIPISYKYQKSVRDYLISREVISVDGSGKKVSGGNLSISRLLYQEHDLRGSMICVRGENMGHTIQLVPEQEITLGRDEEMADVVLPFPLVSRRHCVIIYHEKENEFEITDYSLNGTFLNHQIRLETGYTYRLPVGSYVSFGNLDLEYCLG